MITQAIKEKIWSEVQRRRENFAGSDSRFAVTLGISASQYSRLRNGERERVIGDDQWIRIGRKLDVGFGAQNWKAARTPAYSYIETQLARCQQNSISRMLVRDIVQMCQARRMTCLAEGVETPEQIAALLDAGCSYAQGYYYDPPLPAAEFEEKYLQKLFFQQLGLLSQGSFE